MLGDGRANEISWETRVRERPTVDSKEGGEKQKTEYYREIEITKTECGVAEIIYKIRTCYGQDFVAFDYK